MKCGRAADPVVRPDIRQAGSIPADAETGHLMPGRHFANNKEGGTLDDYIEYAAQQVLLFTPQDELKISVED